MSAEPKSALPRPHEYRFDDREVLSEQLADDVASSLRAAIDDRGSASLALSGGSTPIPFFQALSRQDVDWSRVLVTLADERWVSPDADDSNERSVRQNFMQGRAAAVRFIGLKSAADTPEEGLADTARALAAIARPFDVMVLGMGDDGHTASLFPHTDELAGALDLTRHDPPCASVRPPGLQPRMTLTLPAILDSRRIILHIAGESKWSVYEQALTSNDADTMPIRAVLAHAKLAHDKSGPHDLSIAHEKSIIEVYWAP